MMTHRALLQTRTFGRRAVPVGAVVDAPADRLSNDLRLFAMTFLGGFVFMSVYLA